MLFVIIILSFFNSSISTQGFWSWLTGDQAETAPVYGTPMEFDIFVSMGCSVLSNTYYVAETKLLYMYGASCDNHIRSDFFIYNEKTRTFAYVTGKGNNDQAPAFGTMKTPSATTSPKALYNGGAFFDKVTNYFYVTMGSYGSTSSNVINSMFSYDFNSNQWTWIRGSTNSLTAKNTGTINIPSVSANPGPRVSFAYWYDEANRNFWIFGGYGAGISTKNSYLQDVWMYKVSDDTYTYIGGKGTANAGIYYGPGQWPGSRNGIRNSFFSSKTNMTYLFGGKGLDSASTLGFLADLWTFDPTSRTFQFLGGSIYADTVGNYTDYGLFSPNATIPSRADHVVAFDYLNSVVYIFGGANNNGLMDDLWGYNISSNLFGWMKGSNVPNTGGLSAGSSKNGLEDYFFYPSARKYSNLIVDEEFGLFQLVGSDGIDQNLLEAAVCDVWQFRYDQLGAIVPKVTKTTSTKTEGAKITLSVSGLNTLNHSNTISSKLEATSKPFQREIETDPLSSSNKLNGGAIIGITVAVVFVAIIALVIVWNYRNKSQIYLNPESKEGQQILMATAMAQQQMIAAQNSMTMMAMSMAMSAPSIPEHLRCEKSAFNLLSTLFKDCRSVEPLNPIMKAYGEKLQATFFAEKLEDLDDQHKVFFHQEVQMLWTLRNHRNVAKVLSFCSEPAIILTTLYPLGTLDLFMESESNQWSKKIIFGITADIFRIICAVHSTGHVLRALTPDSFFVETEVSPMKEVTGRSIVAVCSRFRYSLPIFNEELVQLAFYDFDISAENVTYIAPEILEARKNQKSPTTAVSAILRASDIYSFGMMIFAFLKRKNLNLFE